MTIPIAARSSRRGTGSVVCLVGLLLGLLLSHCAAAAVDFLGLDRCLSGPHFLANAGDLAPVFGQLPGGFLVVHR